MICLLEPKSGFEIAFNMFDTDMNKRVDKCEFLVVSFLLSFCFSFQSEDAPHYLLKTCHGAYISQIYTRSVYVQYMLINKMHKL